MQKQHRISVLLKQTFPEVYFSYQSNNSLNQINLSTCGQLNKQFHTSMDSLLPFDHHALENRLNSLEIEKNKSFKGKQAAVLIPLLVSDHIPYVVFTQRSDSLRSHRSQVSFPGGKVDEIDKNLEETALRECHEEIGLIPENVRILGSIDQLLSRNGLLVTPFVGILEKDFEPILNPDECTYIFKVPLTFFLQKEIYSEKGRKNLFMDGICYKTKHWIRVNDNPEKQDVTESVSNSKNKKQTLFTMEQNEDVEFKIWGFSLGVMIQFFKRGWSISHESWGESFDKETFNIWLKSSIEAKE